eukprot:5012577-Pyramimonas_sp.AAC.1
MIYGGFPLLISSLMRPGALRTFSDRVFCRGYATGGATLHKGGTAYSWFVPIAGRSTRLTTERG